VGILYAAGHCGLAQAGNASLLGVGRVGTRWEITAVPGLFFAQGVRTSTSMISGIFEYK